MALLLGGTFALFSALCTCVTLGQNLSSSGFDEDKFLSVLATGELPLIQCCGVGELYRPGLDFCKNESVLYDVDPLPIYSSSYTNSSENPFLLSLNDERVRTQRALKQCPDGFVARTTDRFQLFEDFSMKSGEEGGFLPAADYCIYPQSQSRSAASASGPSFQYAARYCVHADCDNVPCIRKCCPLGMAVDVNDKACKLSDEPFNETVHRVFDLNPEMKIVDGYGFGMNCYDEASNLLELTEFNVLSSGQMYAPDYPYDERATYQYCVDNFVSGISQDQNQKSAMKGLRCFPQYFNLNEANQLAHSIYPYLLFISSGFLFLTFVVYAFLASEIFNAHGLIVMCYVASMAVLYACLGIFQLQLVVPNLPVDPGYTCIGLAVVTHFFFLATFSWLHVMCFDIWRTFRKSTPKPFNRRVGASFIPYSIVGWGFPFLIVLTGQVLDGIVESRGSSSVIQPLFGEGQTCWFNEWKSLFLYLYGPVAVIVLANLSFFVMTAIQLCKTRKESALALRNQQSQNHITRQRIRVIFSLFILMGVSWTMEVISFAVGGSYLVWYIFDMLNIFTGVFVFIIFVCKKKVWKMLKKKFKYLRVNGLHILCPCCPSKQQNPALRASRTSKQSFCRHQSRSSVSTPSQLYFLKTSNDLKTKLSRKSVDEEDTCI
ncbi:probable G-protein coupled receptor Mth-like 3 [Daphnia pulicaria]|uniref:probable G-protein coupled receptor Mth-like 3 n=1 Tax=Daphnia pulicaria TaxID=35523 RepID=UPI001EEBEF95|nr:probable G-protein coupled receptor Mth-like 3 [Daphnia pulicaria]